MTICVACMSRHEAAMITDCRVTYRGVMVERSDHLLKTYPVIGESLLSFAGSIPLAQQIVPRIDPTGLRRAESRGAYNLMDNVRRQTRALYKKVGDVQTRDVGSISFLFAAREERGGFLLAKWTSPKFKAVISTKVNQSLVIGQDEAARRFVKSRLDTAVSWEWSEEESRLMMLASVVQGAIDRYYFEVAKQDLGVSSLLTIFVLRGDGNVSVLPYSISMYRGRLADRNRGLGYAETNEVAFDPATDQFTVIDHQSGKTTRLRDVYDYGTERFGVINTDFDPYKLKA